MATAKKTPSGMYKVRVYSHTTPDGKKHYRAFTAPTKQEAEQQAAKFSSKADRAARVDLTVAEAIDGYITAKEGVLSPSTILGYRRMQQTRYDSIARMKIRRLTSNDLQIFVSGLSGDLSSKTVSNIYGLLVASVVHFAPDMTFRVKLPPKQKKRVSAPSDRQIMELYERACLELKKCIALSAFSSLRRGEICALKYGDIVGNVLHVHADTVRGVNGWIYKQIPKTSDSDRLAPLPQEVIALLGTGDPDDFIIGWVPDTITKRFIDLRNELGLTLKFHDLRHYYASIGAALIPDVYTESFGGWRQGSRVMKEVYQNKIDPLAEQYAQKMTDHFDGLLKNAASENV